MLNLQLFIQKCSHSRCHLYQQSQNKW